jgi:glycosyltransferase involved in cell wall biosynthesis
MPATRPAGEARMRGGMRRLSVTVLNYNYGHFLDQCLASILCQSYTDFEVIVIDDCSADDSLRVITPYLEDPRVRLIAHKENAGFVRSLVEGVEASSSKYLTVISADDFVLNSTAFEQQMNLLEANPTTSFCYASWVYMSMKTQTLGENMPFPQDHVWSGEREFREFCTRFYVLHTGTIIRRSSYEEVGGYDTSIRYTLDNTMWAQLCGRGDVAYVAEPLYGYRTHGGNMSHNPRALRATVDEFVRLVDLGFASLPDGPVKSDARLLRRSRQAALAGVATMQIFAGRPLDGWKAHAYAIRLNPRDALLQRRIISLVARTLLGARLFRWLRSLGHRPVGISAAMAIAGTCWQYDGTQFLLASVS